MFPPPRSWVNLQGSARPVPGSEPATPGGPSAVAGHVSPTRLQTVVARTIKGRGERPDGTGLLASLESSSPRVPCRLPAWKVGHMPRLAQAPAANDIAADPRSIRTAGVLLTSRSPREPSISCTNSENRSGLARWAVLGPEVSIQTSHACQEDDRPLCPTCLHLTSIAGAVTGHVCATRLQRLLPRSIEGRGERPYGTGLLASLESAPPWGPQWVELREGLRTREEYHRTT